MKTDYTAGKLKIFASFYRGHEKLFALDMFCAFLTAAIDLVFPFASRYALNNLLPQNQYTLFFTMVAALVAMYVLRAVFTYIVTYLGHSLGTYIEADMRAALFSHMQRLPFKFYDNHRTGRLMSRLTTDLFEITELAHHGPEDVFISLLTIVGALVILSTINWILALVLLILVPVSLIFTIGLRRRMSRASKSVKQRTSEINADIESSISGVRVAKAYTNEHYEIEKFSQGNERYKYAKKDFYKVMGTFHSGMEFFTNIFHVAVIGIGGYFIMLGTMDTVDVLTFLLYVSTFLQPIRKLTQFMEQFSTGMAGFDRFVEIMRIQPDIQDAPDAKELQNVKGDIAFHDVSFAYHNQEQVLSHINLSIPAGKTVAIVGPSGGGKTTLCHLIPRFYEVTQGSITIDGQDIKSVTMESLRKQIGIVSQDVFLFSGSIRENILYGNVDASDEQVVEAAKSAEIFETILDMPDGLNTNVGERGIKLSGGQKQRISIARIFLKNPPILILDEATSALDTVTERRVQAAFDKLAKGRTTLIIAHRLSTIKNADQIVYIDEEGIREIGTHEELLAAGGAYARLHESQFAGQ